MTEKEVSGLLDEYRAAPENIEAAKIRLKYWRGVGGPVADEEVRRLECRIVALQSLMAAVERALERLPKLQRNILQQRGENVPWWKVARKENYSVRSCQVYFGRAMKSLAGSSVLLKYVSERGSSENTDMRE